MDEADLFNRKQSLKTKTLLFLIAYLISILLKVRQSRNGFFKPMILPKNERTNSVSLPNSTMNKFVCSFFGRIRGYKKVLSTLTDLYTAQFSEKLFELENYG